MGKPPWIASAPRSNKPWSGNGFYQSSAWRKLRFKQLSEHPLCLMCQSDGRVTAATIADHIKPIEEGGEALEQSNLQSLCVSCHNSKSARESHRNRK